MAKKRNVEEIAATVAELPSEPPANAVEFLQKRGLLGKERLIYSCTYAEDLITKKRRKKVKVYCTHCGQESYLEHMSFGQGCSHGGSIYSYGFVDPADHQVKKNGDTCICPACGVGLSALHKSHICRSYEMDRAFCILVHNVRGHLCLLSWTIGKYVRDTGEVFYVPQRWEGDLIVDGSFVRVKGYQRFMSFVSFYGTWVQMSKGIDAIGSSSRSEIMNFTKRDVEATDSPYCALKEYIDGCSGQDRYPGAYLQLWCKYPHVENLVRQGFTRYLNSIINESMQYQGSYNSTKLFHVSHSNKYINWKSKKPLEMLGIDKGEINILKNFKLDTVDLYKQIKSDKGIRLDEDLLTLIESSFGARSVHTLIKDQYKFLGYNIPLIRVLNYLKKQLQTLPTAQANRIGPGILRDYWNYVYRVYGTMQRSELYPKNLVQAHDRFVQKTKEKEEQELVEKFQKRFEDLLPFSYECPALGLLIRPCETQAEMIQEGKLLSHCVGGYRTDHANGKTSIFFVRTIDQPDVPYYTLEYRNDRIVQDHGYKNCLQTEEILAFEQEWLLHVKEIQKQKGKTNGRSSTTGNTVRAGA